MSLDTDGVDSLACATEKDGEGVHEEAGVDAGAEDSDAVADGEVVDAGGEGGEGLVGEGELLAGADDVLAGLDAELEHGGEALELGDGGHDADVAGDGREGLGTLDDDACGGGQAGDLSDVAPYLLGVDVDGTGELKVLAGHHIAVKIYILCAFICMYVCLLVFLNKKNFTRSFSCR